MPSVYHAAILKASEDSGASWASVRDQLLPGAHVILIGDTTTWQQSSIGARKAGLEVRDAIAVLSPSGLDFAVMLRRPVGELSVTAQLLKTGTGALNIDATRVFTDWDEPDRPDSWKRSGHSAKPEAEKIAAPPGTGINCHPKGRWPSNLLFIHGVSCRLLGSKKVRSSVDGTRRPSALGIMNDDGWKPSEQLRNAYGGKDGIETVANWNCAPGCQVAALDRQSGTLRVDASSGGTSRFYKQFKDRVELLLYFRTLILPENGALLEGFPS